MTTKLAECAWEQGQIVKSAMPYDRGEKFLPSVVGNNYDWLRFKCYMGNVGLSTIGPSNKKSTGKHLGSFDDACAAHT